MTLIFMMNDNADSDLALIGEASGGRAPPCGWRMVFRCEFLRVVATLLLVTATLLAMPAASAQAQIFDADADYRVAAGYGSTTTVTLADYLASGVTGVTFTLKSCDAMRADYYSSVAVNAGVVTLVPNTLGHVHGTSANTQTETVCTVTATKTSDSMTQDQEFQFYTTAYRTPFALASNAVVLDEARTNEVDIHINGSLGTGQVKVQWRKSGGSISTRIAQGVSNSTVLTIPGLEANTAYEIRVALMNGMSFDLYRGGQTATPGTLISPISLATKWVQNLGSSGFGKSATLDVTTADVPSLSIDDMTVTEAVGGVDAVFTVTLSNPASTAVTVSYATSNGSGTGAATAGSDYTAISATTLTIGANTLTGTITIRVLDDLVDEPSETFTVTLSSPSGATVADDEGIGTITDNDGVPSLSIDDVTVTEAVGGVDAVFTVTLSNPASTAVTVSYATSNGSGTGAATAGSDYTAISATTLTIGANTLTGTITVRVLDDLVDEPSETFTVTLSSPSGATVADDEGIGTITDNDGVPSLSIDDMTVTEAVGGVDAVFTVTLSNPASTAVTVSYATSNGSGTGAATAGSDYTAISATTLTIGANTLTGTITIRVLDDLVDEPSETFTVTLSSPSGATVADDEGIGTITDNDGVPSLSIDDMTVTEAVGGVDAVFTVTLSNPASTAVTVSYATSNGSGTGAATAGSDYTAISATTLTIGANTLTGTITVRVLDDLVDEPSETFTVTLSSPSGATVADDEGIGTITDNDGVPSLSIDDVTVTEAVGGVDAVFTVTLSNPASTAVTVSYATSNGSGTGAATAGSDYTAISATTLTIGANTLTGTITVRVLDDLVDEPSETFTVTLSSPSGATVADDEGIGTITDNDGVPSLSIDDVTVTEAVGGVDAVFTVTLSNPASTAVTVSYATSNGSGTGAATAGSDYTAISATTLTIGANTLTGTITVRVLDDLVDEPSETFTVTLSSPSGATVADDEGIGTITDNDGVPSLSIDDVTVTEAVGGVDAVFTVTLSNPASTAVTVSYATSNGSGTGAATAGSDYTAISATTLTIGANTLTGTITVRVLDDLVDEPSETFTVTLSSPSGATVADDEGIGTITDNDGVPSLSIDDMTVTEAVGGVDAVFTVTLSAVSGRAVTVDYETSNGTATEELDYETRRGTLTIPAGKMEGTIPIPVLDDALDEPSETFTVTLSGPTSATVQDGVGMGTIEDNDAPPSLRIEDVTVVEGTTAEFTVRLSAASAQEVTVAYATSDGTAEEPSDYTETSSTLTFTPGEMEKRIRVPVLDDTVNESDETFTVTLSAPRNATVERPVATGTITDDSGVPSLSINDVTVTEVVGGVDAVFTVTLSNPASTAVTVSYATSNGSGTGAATAGSDYTAISATTLTIGANTLTGTITVRVLDDLVDEPSETFTVTLSSPSGATVADDEGIGTIIDNDGSPSLSIGDVTVGEGAEAEFTVTLSAVSGLAVMVDFTTSDVSALAELDYETRSGRLTIPAGSTTGKIPVPVLDDVLDEPDETFTVTLSNPTNATVGDGTGTGTITDDDSPPTLSIGDVTVTEDSGTATFTVRLNVPIDRPVTVDFTTVDGSAVADSDYTATEGMLTFAPGETEKTITVVVLEDPTDEPDEMFVVLLSNPDNAVFADNEATGTITERRGSSPIEDPTISIEDVTVSETGGTALFTVSLSGPSPRVVTVDFRTMDGTAEAVLDYTATDGTVRFEAGETEQTITVSVLDDTLDEPDETFTVTLSNPTNATVADNEGIGTITDDDYPAVAVLYGAVSYTVTEGGSVEVTVVLSAPPGRRVVILLTHMPGGGALESDYSGVPVNVAFDPGETRQTFTVTAVEDAEYDDGESVVLGFGALPQGVTAADPEIATVTIDDNNHVPGAVPREWLGRFGRTAVTHVVDALDERMRWLAEPPRCAPDRRPEDTVTGTGTITDDEGAPTLSIDDATVIEASGAVAEFTVTLSAVSAQAVTVAYATSDGTAVAGSDYTTTGGTLTFAPGETSKTVMVPVTANDVDEPDEIFSVTLSASTNATVVDGEGTGTITDDEGAPTLSIDDATVIEASGAVAEFTVTLSAVSAQAVTVAYATSDGTAVAGSDYTTTGGTLTFAPGETSKTVMVPVTANDVDEPDEIFSVTLSASTNATVVDGEGTGTITDDEGAPTLSLDDATVIEASGAVAEFTVTLSAVSAQAVTRDLGRDGGGGIGLYDHGRHADLHAGRDFEDSHGAGNRRRRG